MWEWVRSAARMHLLVFAALLASVAAGPTLYNIDKEAGTAERVMVPVSSTVIPLEELPETQVGFGFGIANKGHHIKKPAYLKVRFRQTSIQNFLMIYLYVDFAPVVNGQVPPEVYSVKPWITSFT